MESIVLSMISSYLKVYVNNFRKEQISMNFLRGQGVIKDLDINVDAINEAVFQNGMPGLKFSRILINKLSIEAPIMSLKTKPIVVFIDELFVEITEVTDILKKPKDSTSTNAKKASAKYGFMDRIVDSVTFQINHIFVGLRTLGKIKTTEIGPWTPPVLLIELSGNRFFNVNHNGVECELEECFRIRQTKRSMLFIYKKFESRKVSMYLVEAESWFQVVDEILSPNKLVNRDFYSYIKSRDTKNPPQYNSDSKTNRIFLKPKSYLIYRIIDNIPFEILLCMRKRIDNNVLLGLEISFNIDTVNITTKQFMFKELMNLLISLSYCILRKDAIEELYGSDPHQEKLNNNNSGINSSNVNKISREQLGQEEKETLDQLESEAMFSAKYNNVAPDKDASSGASSSTGNVDWQRSTLNSDVDPPHLRLVIVAQINKAVVKLSFDELIDETAVHNNNNSNKNSSKHNSARIHTNNSTNKHNKAHHSSDQNSDHNSGVILTTSGLVYSSIWPEHAAATESMMQISMKYFSVQEYSGSVMSTIIRVKQSLDEMISSRVNNSESGTRSGSFDNPGNSNNSGIGDDNKKSAAQNVPNIALQSRGVKEIGDRDLEILPGICLLYRKEANWPPPPIHLGVSISSEIVLCPIVVAAVNVEVLCKLRLFIEGAWDKRWTTGDWDLSETAHQNIRVEGMHGAVSSNMVITLCSVDVLLYPSLQCASRVNKRLRQQSHNSSSVNNQKNSGGGSSSIASSDSSVLDNSLILPTLVTVSIGQTTLTWKHTLEFSLLPYLFNSPSGNNSNNINSNNINVKTECDTFPHSKSDLTSLLILNNSLSVAKNSVLICPRFDAQIAGVTVSISNDNVSHIGALNSKSKQNKHQSAGREQHNTPHVNKIIQIAQLSHFISLDPHPHREQDQLSGNLQSYANANPYDREYYWKSGQSMIRSSGVSVLDVLVDVSLLDTIKLTESVYQYQTVIEHHNRLSAATNRAGSNKTSVEVTNLGSSINDNYVSFDGTTASSDQAQQSTEPQLNELLLTDQPSTVNIFRVSIVHINVLKDCGRAQRNTFDSTINTTATATTSSTTSAPTIVEIKLHSGCVVFEQTSADTSDISNPPDDRALRDRNPVIKGTVSEISIISGAQSILSVSLPATEQHNVDPSDDLNAGNRIHGNSSGSIAQFRVENVWEDTHVSGDHCGNSNAADGYGDEHNLDADVDEILRRNNVAVGSAVIGSSVTVSDTETVVTTQSTEDATSKIPSNTGNDAPDDVTVVLHPVDESIHHSVAGAFAPNVSKDTSATQKKLCKQVSIQVTPSVLCTADISPVEAAMKTVLSELLTGSGSIHPTTTNIWDDSILGYFKRIVRKAMHFSSDSGDKETERSEKYTSDNTGNNTSDNVAVSDATYANHTSDNTSSNESDYSIAVDVKLPHFTFSVMDVDSPSTLSLEWTNLILHSYKESPHTPVWSVSLVTMLCMYISKVTIDSHSLKIENEIVPLVENFSFSTAFSNYEVHKECADSGDNSDIINISTRKKQFDPAALFIQSNTLLSQVVSCCSYEDVLTVSQLCSLLLRRVSSIQGLVNIFHETTGRSAGKVDRHKKLLNSSSSSNNVSNGDQYSTSSNNGSLTSQLVSTAVEVVGTVNQMTDSRHLLAQSADHYTALMQLFDLQYSNNSDGCMDIAADGGNGCNDNNGVYSSNNSGREQQVTQIDSYKQYIRTEIEILLHLQKEFNIIYHNLAGIEKRHNDGTVRSSADSAQNLLMFSEVKTSIEKVQQAYNYYSGQVPVYCGWTNNSGGFVRSDKSGLAQRSWTSLVQGTLYFLSQPYSNQITNEIALDMSGTSDAHNSHTSSVAAYTVVDPDHSERFTSNKAALTTRIFICPAAATDSHSHNTTSSSLFGSSSSHGHSSHGSGGDSHVDPSKVYIITCDSLDEKLAWLDALEPWLVSSSATSASTDTKRISIFRRNSHKSILSALTTSPAKSNSAAAAGAASDDGSSGGKPTLGDKKSSFKFFSSFTKSKAKPALTSVAENGATIADSDTLGTIPTSGSNSSTSHNLNQTTGTYEDSSSGTLDDQFLKEYIAQSERSNELTRSEDGAMSCQIKDTQRFVAEAVLLLNSLILTAKKTSKILHEAESLGARSLSSVLSELRDQKERNRQLESQCAQARSAEAELNFVLQACTMQHINTVQEMATRMDNIMMKYNTLRGATANKGAASTSYGGSSGTNIHELVEHLTVAVSEKDRLLRECDAKLNMTEQEMLSQQVEARSARKELQTLQASHAKLQESSQQEIRALSELCRVESEVRQSVERERDEYKSRYEQLLSNFVALGINTPSL